MVGLKYPRQRDSGQSRRQLVLAIEEESQTGACGGVGHKMVDGGEAVTVKGVDVGA